MVGIGAAIGVVVILADRRLEARGSAFRVPALAVALGIYLPLKLSAAILAGGLVSAMAKRGAPEGADTGDRKGLLFAAGLVTGEALMGILLAVPIALSGFWPAIGADPFQLVAAPPLGGWPGLAVLTVVALLLYRTGRVTIQR
jgi:uncharacterized oligopeptide transporter (OPT) family protein